MCLLSRVTEVLRSAIHWIQIHRSVSCCHILITGTNFSLRLELFNTGFPIRATNPQTAEAVTDHSVQAVSKPSNHCKAKSAHHRRDQPNQTIHRGRRHLEVQCVNEVDWWFTEVEPPHQMEKSPVCVVNGILCQMHESHRSSLGSLEEGGWVN